MRIVALFLTLMTALSIVANSQHYYVHVKKQRLSLITGPVAWLQSDPAGGVYSIDV